MRPIFLEYPRTENFYGEDREFLFGRDLLVAPQIHEMLDAYEVKLPPGEWYDYWTNEKHKSDKPIKVKPSLSELPLYVRAGAILPQQPIVQSTQETPDGPLELRVYPGDDCRGSLYLDDGHSYAYTRGDYLRVEYTCRPAADSLAVTVSSRQGSFKPWWDKVRVEIFGVEKTPKEVSAGGRSLKDWGYDARQKSVSVTLPDAPAGWQLRLVY